jgi:AP-1-like transcription factor
MEDLGILVDTTTFSHGLTPVFGDAEGYMDSAHSSASTGPGEYPVGRTSSGHWRFAANSNEQYDLAFDAAYDSPEQIDGLFEESHTAGSTPPPAKPAAKRRRENRYKNAPPSVLSVSLPSHWPPIFWHL